MIEATDAVFPNNVVELTALCMRGVDPDVFIARRPLRNTDPNQSIGVFAQMWDPDPESLEMLGADNTAPQRPTIQRYVLGVQAFVKDGDEERGLATHSVLAQRVRSVLYTDPNLRLSLAGLSVKYSSGVTEVLQRWGIRTARYFSGEIDANLLYLSTLEFWIETETR